MTFYRTVALLVLLICAFDAAGQEMADFNINSYNSDNGLPQNSVGQAVTDKNGFLWLTTQGGLVRFDGSKFVTYNRQNVSALTSDRIIDVGLRTDGIVFFTDENFHLFTFDENNQVIRLPVNNYNKVYMIRSKDRYDDIIASLDAPSRQIVDSLAPKFQAKVSFLQTKRAGEGYLWLNLGGIAYLSDGRVKSSIMLRRLTSWGLTGPYGLFNDIFYGLDITRAVNQIDHEGNRKPVFIKAKVNGNWQDITTQIVGVFPGDKTFYIHYGNTISEIRSIEGDQLFSVPVLKVAEGDIVTSFKYVRNLDLYIVGSSNKGFSIYKPKYFNVLRIPGSNNIFYGQARYMHDGVLTEHGIVFPDGSTKASPVSGLLVQCGMLRDASGNFWVSGESFATHQLGPDLRVIRKTNVRRSRVYKQTPDGNVWISTIHSQFGRIFGDTAIWMMDPMQSGRLNFIPADNHNFWMGYEKGMFRYNVLTRKKTVYPELNGKEVRELYIDKRKTLWIGTYGHGFYGMKNGKPRRLPLDKHKYLMYTHCFLEDQSGFMWMSTNHGLFKCKSQDLHDYLDGKSNTVYYHYYDKSSGFGTNEFNGGVLPAGIVFPDGRFSFPSMDGLVQFYPDSIKDILPSSKILIDNFIVDGQKREFSGAIRIAPSFDRMEIRIASPFFGTQENQNIEYNIRGLDEKWYPVNADGLIILNRLPYGDYKLQVRKISGFGRNNRSMLVKKFTVAPFWYQTWYFRDLALLLALSAFYVIVRLRYFYLERRRRQLEMQVSERTSQLEESKTQLEYSNKLKEKITIVLAHDLQSPLHFLNVLSNHVSTSLDKSKFEDARTSTEEIKKATANIHAFVKEINLWTRSQEAGFYLNKHPFSIMGLLDELGQFFKEMLLLTNNVLEVDQTRDWEVYTNREILKAVLRNLIDNSNKYTSSGKITISLHADGPDSLCLTVSDTGEGMSPADLRRINRRIENVSTHTDIEHNKRIGYQLIIDFVARLECKLEVLNPEGAGTMVKISGLPLASAISSGSGAARIVVPTEPI